MSDDESALQIYVCTNVDCRSRGSLATIERLKERLRERGWNHVSIKPIVCFSACNVGPNVVLPAQRRWLSGVTAEKIDAVLDHLATGADVSALQKDNDPELDKMIFEMIDAGLLEEAEPG